MAEVIYCGLRWRGGATEVWRRDEHGREAPLNWRADLRDLGADRLDWGYGRGGTPALNAAPAQLALAILADATGADGQALALFQAFKWAVVAAIRDGRWELPRAAVRSWRDDFMAR